MALYNEYISAHVPRTRITCTRHVYPQARIWCGKYRSTLNFFKPCACISLSTTTAASDALLGRCVQRQEYEESCFRDRFACTQLRVSEQQHGLLSLTIIKQRNHPTTCLSEGKQEREKQPTAIRYGARPSTRIKTTE